MQFSFMDDPRWAELDDDTKSEMINVSFNDTVSSDPRWAELDDDTKQQMQNSFVQDAEAYNQKVMPHAEGFTGAVFGGMKQAASSVRTAGNVLTGDDDDVKTLTEDASRILKTPEQTAFGQALQERKEDDKEGGVWTRFKQGVGNVAGAAWNEPVGALHEVAGQAPNAAVAMGSMWAGAQAGALAMAPVPVPGARVAGGIAGGIIGLLFGNTALETGGIAQEQVRAGEYDRGDVLKKGAIKGAVITGVDTASMGLSKAIFTPAFRAAGKASQEAVEKILKANSVNPFDDAAVTLALSQDAGLKKAVVDAGAKAALEAAPKGVKNAGIHGTAFAMDMAGEGVGEYYGSKAAGLDADITDAILEAAMSIPQGAAEVAVGKSLAKGKGLLSSNDTASNIDTAQSVDEAVQAFEKTVSDDLNQEQFLQGLLSQEQMSGQELISQESDGFDQFQEGFRDQKIEEFEQNLKQAQADIQTFPDRPPIQPDVEALRREYGNKQSEQQGKAGEQEILNQQGQRQFNQGLLSQGQMAETDTRGMPRYADVNPFAQQQSAKKTDDVEKKMVHDHSSTQVDLPIKEANKIRAFAKNIPDSEIYTVPDDPSYGREDEPHITVKYGLKTNTPKDIVPIIKGHPPITAKMGKVSIFENDKYDVVKVEVDSPELRALNKKIEQKAEISLPKGETFDYLPHATIAYVQPGQGKKYVGDKSFAGKEITFDSLTVSTRDGKLHQIPLSGSSSQNQKNDPQITLPSTDEPQKPAKAKPTIASTTTEKKLDTARRPDETHDQWLNRLIGKPKDWKLSKADKLRKQAEKLGREAHKMLEPIEPGQPVFSTRDRNLRERAAEKMRKAVDLAKQADAIEDKATEQALAQSENTAKIEPGATVTWKNKKGQSFVGTLVSKKSGSKSTWQIDRGNGKRTFLLEKSFSVVPKDEVSEIIPKTVSIEDQAGTKLGPSRDQVGTKSVKTDQAHDQAIPSKIMVKAKNQAAFNNATRLVYENPNVKDHWIVSSRGPGGNYTGKIYSVMPDGAVDIWRDGGKQVSEEDVKKLTPVDPDKKIQEVTPTKYGSKNKVFTKDAAEKARELLRKKLSGNQLNSGIDPEVMLAGIQLAGYHVEAGARTFAAYSKAMVEDVGDSVKPYLRSFYEGVRHFPEFDSTGMTDSNDLDKGIEESDNEIKSTPKEVKDERSQENDTGRPGIQSLDKEDSETVSGGRDGVLARNVNSETTGHDSVLETPSTEDVRGPESDGPVDGDGLRPGMQDDGGMGQSESVRDEPVGREAASGTGLDDNGPGGTGRSGEPNRVLENYHIEDPDALIGGTPKVRFKKNKKAIEVFNDVSNEGRRPTDEERDAMASYIGWGSFGQELFQGTFENPIYKDGWANEGEWLREHLGKSAWESAQASIINAHYTDPPTVSAVWDIVKKLGFNGGRVLEPSMGVGNFFGLMPKTLKSNSDLTGIELDEITAGMAKMLYPDANIQQMGYEKSKTADGFYDLVLGNWPFAAQGPADRRYNKYNLTLHDYFFVKALDQVRDGGLVVGITASGTMDKVGKMARRQMEKRADLVAAFRMPAGAFKKYAGTSVVADIIVLQKRAEGVTANHDAAWMDNTILGKASDGKNIKVNEYWTHKPENVLGNMAIGHGTTQGREGMIVERKRGYEDVLTGLSGRMPKNIVTKRGRIDHVNYITNNTTERQNSVIIKDNGLHIVKGERLASLNDILKYSVKDKTVTKERESQLRSMVRIRERYGKLLDAERNGEKTAENHRKLLNQLYQSFVKKYGTINESFALKHFSRAGDPMAPAMAALENNTGTKEKPVYEPAKILTESTQRQKSEIENPSISDAFVMARNEVARVVDIEAIAEKAGTTPEAVKSELIKKDAIFETPAGTIEVKNIYLSGNVREKLYDAKVAKEDGLDMDRNIKALEAVIPEDIPYFNIEANLGAAWIPAETYHQFITDVANLPEDVAKGIRITSSNNGWIVKFDDAGSIDRREEVRTVWGTLGAPFTRILRAAFTGQTITIKAKDQDGNEFIDQGASAEANEKVDAFREALKDWIWKDVDRRVYLERHYNETMNAWATPEYDGSFLSFDGMMLQIGESEFNLRSHQVNAIWRGIANGRGLYAHEVGTGKTFTMGGVAVESRRYGLAKKPLILGHNANSASVAEDIQMMYPGAKVLYIDNLTPKTINQKLYQIANDDWDAVVLPHSLLDRLTLSRETLDRLAQDDIIALEDEAIASAADEGFDIEDILDDEDALKKIRGAATAKEMVKQRNRIIQNIEKQAQAASREGAIPFEDLGIDMIIVDEVHEFKKPPLSTKMKVKGLNTATSNRSIALNFLTSYIKENNGGKGVHLFTGTPITNTLNEIYNHMRYIMSSEMEKADVLSWDSWFNTFASVESDIERTASGDYETVSRLSGFHNVSELRKFAGQFMDIVFADEMPEFVSRKTKSGKDLHYKNLTESEKDELLNGRADKGKAIGRPYKKLVNEVADMSDEQRDILETIIERSKSFKNASGKERREIMLSGDSRNPVIIETDAAKAGFDPRLYDKALSDHPQNKINRCVNNVIKHYQEHEKASQVIFMEKGYSDQAKRSTRDADGEKSTYKVDTFNASKEIKKKLIESGIPENQIAIVNGSVAKKKRLEIANKVNSGEIRVVIGLTSTLGTGTNMQENLRAMHHLDAPWMPGELEQRNGRGHRQGNRWNTVLEYRYITESIDARRWQVLAKKQKIITDFLKAKDGVRSIEGDVVDIGGSDLDEINSSFSEAAGDARILIREKFKKDIERLEKKKRTHGQGIVDAKEKIKDIEGRNLPNLKDRSKGIQSDMAHYQSVSKDPWTITIDGKKYTKRQKAGVAFEKLSLKLSHQGLRISEKKKIGEYSGFDIMVSGSIGKGNNYSLDRELSYPIQPAIGSIDYLTRNFKGLLENTQTRIAEKESALKKFKQVVKEPFAQEDALKNKKDSLDQIEKDLENNPDAPPSWLAQGAPVGTDVYYNGEPWEVEGHRKGEHGHYVIIKQGEKQEVVDYLEVMDENNMPVYDARDDDEVMDKEDAHGDAKLSTSTDTTPGQGITLDRIKSQYPGQHITTNKDGNLSIRFTNGKGVQIETVNHIGGNDIRVAMKSGRMKRDGVILGKYQAGKITINMNMANIETAIHENYHALKALGMITPADEKTIDNFTKMLKAQGKYRYDIQEDMEENQANTLAQLVTDRANYREGSKVRAIIQKVMDFFDALVHIGRQSARKLAREYESGKIYSRETNSRQTMSEDKQDASQFSVDTDTVSTKEKKKAYRQIAAGLKNVIKNRKNKGPNYKKDIGVIENTLGLMSHYSEDIPALNKTFEELLKRPEWKFQKENELYKNGEESKIGTMEDLQKHNKAAYVVLKDYLIKSDIDQIGNLVKEYKPGKWQVLSVKNKKTGKRKILRSGFESKFKAREWSIENEVSWYPDKAARDALRAFRTMTANLHDFYAESWETLMQEYEDRGLTLPEVVTQTKAGEVRVDLKVALAKMGERSSYYFPRQRSNGDWRVYAEKEGEHPFVEYRDFKSTADYLAGKMEAQGYTVNVEKVGSMSEDIYQNVKSILSTQAMVNQALSETKMDVKLRKLEDVGLKGEWRGDDYVIPAGGVYEWSETVLKEIGGQPYSDLGRKRNGLSPGYRFDNAPKDMPEIVTNAIFRALNKEPDISFEIAENLANQLTDTLRARGSRARMIARSDAVGKNVPVGYETDPVKAIAQAVNSAAGGYAKQQVALNTSKAITGQHYTWDEWLKQHRDYDALQAVEESIKTMQKNSETENERIDVIDQKIKELQRERVGVKTESEAARQERLFRIGTLFREKDKIRKWKNDDQAAAAHKEVARLRAGIHKEYRQYIQDNMLDPKRQKRAYTDAVNAVENVLKNDEAGDRVINTLKGLASVWFLGGRLSSAAINLTAMGTTVPAAMDAYGGIPLRKTVKHIAKAGKAYASFVTGKGKISKEDRAILEDIFSRGWVAAQLNMETINALKSGPAQKYGKVVELLMTPFKITEEFNRGVTLFAAYKGIMSENPGMSKEDALSKAKKVSDRAHGIYGVENQPALLRKGRGLRAASAMYIFQTFMHNYFTTLSYMIGRQQAASATYMILSPMLFGGAASSILLPAVKMIFKAMGEDDPEEKIYQVAQDLFGETGDNIARYGLPGLAGISLKGSLAPGLPDFKEPLDALGPIGGMMRNIFQGGVNITHGDYLKGIEKITPLAMGNIAKAYRETSEGVTTRSGDQVFFGRKQIKGDLGTGVMRAAGLNPIKIAKPREVQWNETTLKREYAEKKRRLYGRIVHYHAQPISRKNPNEWRDIVSEIKEFNARVKSNNLTDIVPQITGKTIKARIRRAFRPSKRERERI